MKTLSGSPIVLPRLARRAHSFGFRFKVRVCRETFSGTGQDGHAAIIAIANLIHDLHHILVKLLSLSIDGWLFIVTKAAKFLTLRSIWLFDISKGSYNFRRLKGHKHRCG